jgi:hypothetical protein
MEDAWAEFQMDEPPVPDSRLPIVPQAGPGYSGGAGTGRPLRVDIVGGDAAPSEATDEQQAGDPWSEFQMDSAPVGLVDVPPSDVAEAPTWGGSTANALAAVGQGLAGIPDAATNALGAVMGEGARYGAKAIGAGADALGLDGESIRQAGETARTNLYNPITIGGLIEKAAPTPDDAVGKGVRIVGQLGAGLMTIPGVTPFAKSLPKALGIESPAPLLSRVSPGQEVAAAADRIGAKVLPADVGGTTTKMLSSYGAKTLGAIPMAKAAKESVESVGTARNVIAEGAGRVADAEGAGEAAQKGARTFIEQSGKRGGDLFDKALAPIAPQTPVVVDETIAATRQTLRTLSQTPEIAALMQNPTLKKFGEALASDAGGTGSIPLEAARRLRTAVGEALRNPSLTDDIKTADLKRVYAALSGDIERSVEVASKTGAAPPKALTDLKRANAYWKARQDRIDNVLSVVLGKDGGKGGQPAYESLLRLGKKEGGDPAKLSRLLRSLPDEEAATVRATVIKKLGEASAGTQDAAGTVFSPGQFVTQWNKMSPRAKSVLFGENQALRKSLDDLATVANGMKEAGKLQNFSNTSIGTNLTFLTGLGFANYPAAIVAAGMQFGAGKLLVHPQYVRWLAKAGKIQPAQGPGAVKSHLAQLAAIASRDNAPADITAFERILQGANDNLARSGSVAASPNQGPDEQ